MGAYRHKQTGSQIQAWYFDGTDESARAIFREVVKRRGSIQIIPAGSWDYDLHNAYLQLEKNHQEFDLVRQGDWVIDTMPERDVSTFHIVHQPEFAHLYEPVTIGESLDV